MNTDWKSQIEKLTVDDLLRIFPSLGLNTAYAWKSGRRTPPEYSQAALAAWIKSSAKPTAKKRALQSRDHK